MPDGSAANGDRGWKPQLVEVRVTQSDARAAIIEVIGEIDMSNVASISTAFDCLGEVDTATIDLAGVTFIDSSGIRECLRLAERGAGQKPQVSFSRPSGAVLRVFEIAGVADRLQWTAGEPEATG